MKTPNHLGGHAGITHVDAGALRWLAETFWVQTMVDVGCGPGGQCKLARIMGIDATGIDGDNSVKPDVLHDFTSGPLPKAQQWDLGWCVEFLEHVEERFLPNVMSLFQGCKAVCITHALPGTETAHHHVNCQLSEYWINNFKYWGMSLDKSATKAVRENSTMTRNFMRTTGMVFV